MTEKRYDAILVGLQCVDITASPVREGPLQRELTLTENISLSLGGDALNQAVVLSRLGARVGLMGLVGQDSMGDVLLQRLSSEKLEVLDKREDVPTAVSIVLVDGDGERHFVYQPESNLRFTYEHIKEEAIRNTAFLSIGGCLSLPGLDGEGMVRLLALAKESGAQTAIDFRISGYPWSYGGLEPVFRNADYLLPSLHEAKAITGETDPEKIVARLQELGAGNCLVKMGADGCYVSADGFQGVISAYPCRCIDTTGAGDTFAAAFVYAKLSGWDIEKCASFANAAGALAVEYSGANKAQVSVEKILNKMDTSLSGNH